MTYTEAYRHYLGALRANPQTPPPAFRMANVDDFHAWKAEMRAYDAARLELKLATPAEIQTENAAIRVRGRSWRIVEHAQHP
jgi:hypothetical protein